VEIWLVVLNRLESLPAVTADSVDKDVQDNLELIEYLHAQYVQDKARTDYDFERMKPQYLRKQRDDSSHSETEGGGGPTEYGKATELPADRFSRDAQVKKMVV
jgi:hypothetical protein